MTDNTEPIETTDLMPKGYVRLDRTLIGSTVWAGAPTPNKLVWITLLCLMDAKGYIWESLPGIATYAGVSVEDASAAMQTFEDKDPMSRSKGNEGRRIEQTSRGWRVLNADAYRRAQSPQQRADAERKRSARGKTE